ncbi:MAG: hypothetical protein JOZ09_16845 [Pseudonocardiales bacterium]|nr:hypothetical protein [Pseudonocardiales bacterium]
MSTLNEDEQAIVDTVRDFVDRDVRHHEPSTRTRLKPFITLSDHRPRLGHDVSPFTVPGMLASTAATRTAVEFLTLWMDSDERAAIEHIGWVLLNHDLPGDAVGDVATTVEATVTALAGQLNLSMFLLHLLAEELGATNEDEVQGKATEILQELSLRLPE